MNIRTITTVAAVFVAVSGACSSTPAATHQSAAANHAAPFPTQPTADSVRPPSAGAGPSGAPARRSTTSTWTPHVINGIKEAPPPPPGGSYARDSFDRRAHLPEGAMAVVRGHNARGEWRLYVFRDEKNHLCLQFAAQSVLDSNGNGTGAVGGTCSQKPPLDRSGSDDPPVGSFGWGLTSSDIATVRYEHADGTSESFQTTSGGPAYAERFYALELVSPAPISRIVGLDAGGHVVVARTDNDVMNRHA